MNTKKFIASSFLAITMLRGSSLARSLVISADTISEPNSYVDSSNLRQEIDGGTWEYGYNLSNAYSQYYHSYNKHGARVVNKQTGKVGTKNMRPGAWAIATVGRNLVESATFYYKSNGYYG